jgi:hypothetical protein
MAEGSGSAEDKSTEEIKKPATQPTPVPRPVSKVANKAVRTLVRQVRMVVRAFEHDPSANRLLYSWSHLRQCS